MRTVRTGQQSTPPGAITPVVAIEPKARAQTKKFVLEVTDLENADIGEQLSLTEMMTAEPSPKSSRSRKSTAKSTKSTVSKARQKTAVEASLKVPIESPPVPSPTADASQELVVQFQQLRHEITQLQTRLANLDAPTHAAHPANESPSPTGSDPSISQHVRLPDWRDPELRPHYTLREAQVAYDAIEQQQQQRTYKTVAPEELAAAQQTAQHLRQPLRPHPPAQRRQQSRPSPRRSMRRSRRRFRWDAHRFVSNVYQLILRLIPIPPDPGTKMVDAATWILASIGLRLVLKLLLQFLPMLAWPTHLLLALPALVAAYLAFCVAHSRSDVIYRLLLITVGLFLGSRL
jgi:hypothetical protein